MCMISGNGQALNPNAVASNRQPAMGPPPSPAAAPISQPAAMGAPVAPGAVAKPGMVAPVFGSQSQAKQAQDSSKGGVRIVK